MSRDLSAASESGTDESGLKPLHALLAFLPVLVVLAPWTVATMGTALNADHAWLLITAERMLNGGTHLRDFFHPNPPLSVLLYVPDVLLSRATGIPVWYTPYIEGFAALALSTLAVFLLLKAWPILEEPLPLVVAGIYVLASTYLATAAFFAERDEFVAWGLVPFLIVQLAITQSAPLPRSLLWAVLIAGSACIMIKPQFALLPAMLLAHRAYARRSMGQVLRDSDFIALAAAVLIYALVIAIFFRDFITYVVPDFLKLYIPDRRPDAMISVLPKAIALPALLLVSWKMPVKEATRRAIQLCVLASAVCGELFILQGKGLYYHMIPALIFFYCAAGICVCAWAFPAPRNRAFAAFCALAAMSFIAFRWWPIESNLPTHAEYARLKLPQLAAEAGPKGSFYVFSEGFDMVPQASLYSGAAYASRFSNLWWFSLGPDGSARAGLDVYANYMAEDLRRYKPAVIANQINIKREDGKSLDLVAWLSRFPAFREEMSHYRKTGQLADNRRDYFRGTSLDFSYPLIYDIYRRVPDGK